MSSLKARPATPRLRLMGIGHRLRRGGAAYGVLLISLLLTALAYYYVRQNVEAHNRLRFEEITRATQEAIERRTQAYLDAMLGARGLFYASESVTPEEWNNYVEGIEPGNHFEGLQALSYAQRVEPEQREAFARRMQEEGLPEMRPDLDPGGERSAYFPITYTGPLDGANADLLGYDFYAEATHRAAMDQARDTGSPQATKRVYVLTEAPAGSTADLALEQGFLVYLPVYKGGEPQETVAERRRALEGFVVGSFVVDGLLGGVFKGAFDPAVDFEVYDGTEAASSPLLYDSDGIKRADERGSATLFSKESRLRIAGRKWSLYFATLPRFERGAESNLPLFVLASGITVSLLLFGITSMLVRSRTLAEHASRDLEEANSELEAFYYSVEQELALARRIQHALLPKDLPELEGWQIAHRYRPAREVGGDFYDFLRLEDGRIGLVFGDVSGKGIAAALVMANTQSVLRAAQRKGSAPGRVLEEANRTLRAYVPPNTFATCFYAILDPKDGRLVYANAGHDLPYLWHGGSGGSRELEATGMPLGLMPDMSYEEQEAALKVGDSLLFYSDGLVEAHDPEGEMFGFPRLGKLVAIHGAGSGEEFLDHLLKELYSFTGEDWEQEDDITLVTLHRTATRD